MGGHLPRFTVVLLAVAGLMPLGLAASAACPPRTLTHLGPAPNLVEPAPEVAPEPTPPAPDPAADPAALPLPTETPAPSTPTPSVPSSPNCNFIYRFEFPTVGGGQIGSVFGDVREGGDRWHAGVDIFAPKLTPVVAARAGTVSAIHAAPGDCCWLSVRHDDGWFSWYLHLNNDAYGTDDGTGAGIRPDLVVGMRVAQGEVLGWIGDSGNAETAVPHLHFELRTPWGVAVDPGPSLSRARRYQASSFTSDEVQGRPAFAGPYFDDDQHPAEALFGQAVALGIPTWCDPWAVRACPEAGATRDALMRWLTALNGGEAVPTPSVFALPEGVEMFIALGPDLLDAYSRCDDPLLCDQPVTRGEVAAALSEIQHQQLAADPSAALSAYRAHGWTDTCTQVEGQTGEIISRAGLLQMLLRAYGHLPAPPCDQIS